jgi:hypothetical protein
MKRLTGLNKPYKYVVTCIIMQKTGAQPQRASSTALLLQRCAADSSSVALQKCCMGQEHGDCSSSSSGTLTKPTAAPVGLLDWLSDGTAAAADLVSTSCSSHDALITTVDRKSICLSCAPAVNRSSCQKCPANTCSHMQYIVCILRRCWPTHCCILLLGQHNRRQPDSALGEQNHVLHNHSVWASAVIGLLAVEALSSSSVNRCMCCSARLHARAGVGCAAVPLVLEALPEAVPATSTALDGAACICRLQHIQQ